MLSLFTIVIIIGHLINNESLFYSIKSSKYFIFALLTFHAYKALHRSQLLLKHFNKLVTILVIFSALTSLVGLISLNIQYNPLRMKAPCHLTRNCGLFGMYMTYAYQISLFLSLQVGLFYTKGYTYKKLLWFSLILNLLGLYFSYTRGATLGLLLSLPFYLLKEKYVKRYLMFVLVSSILVFTVLFSPKIGSIFFNNNRLKSNNIRVSQFKAAIKTLQEKPFFGLGHKKFEPNSKRIKKKYNISFSNFQGHAHNNILELLASTGLLGGISYILFLFFWLKESLLNKGDLFSKISIVFLINFFISGLTQYSFGDGENLFLILNFWAIFASRENLCQHS